MSKEIKKVELGEIYSYTSYSTLSSKQKYRETDIQYNATRISLDAFRISRMLERISS